LKSSNREVAQLLVPHEARATLCLRSLVKRTEIRHWTNPAQRCIQLAPFLAVPTQKLIGFDQRTALLADLARYGFFD
jgi:hypothetical protein